MSIFQRISIFLLLAGTSNLAAQSLNLEAGRRVLPSHEADVFGPLPFPEEVIAFVDHELDYLLRRQSTDGHWESAQPMGKGRTTLEAGGTVGNVLLTSMCGYTLRGYLGRDPLRYEQAIQEALEYVVSMVANGKLHGHVMDAPWQYIYTLRFLVSEYPHVQATEFKKRILDAATILIDGLKETQTATKGERSLPFEWKWRSSPGMLVADTEEASAVVLECRPESPAYKAGIRKGDQLISADKRMIDTEVRYALSEFYWKGGDDITFSYIRDGNLGQATVILPRHYPGSTGVRVDHKLLVTVLNSMSNPEGSADFLENGDRILAIDGKKISTVDDLNQAPLFAGAPYQISVSRNGKKLDLKITAAPVATADLGLKFTKNHFEQSPGKGLRIGSLSKDSPLKAAGLIAGDSLLRIDGSLIPTRKHYHDFIRTIWGGKKIKVTYLRNGEKSLTEVTTNTHSNQSWLKGYHGLTLARGQKVLSVDYQSPADLAGCKKGDVIIEMNGSPVIGDRDMMTKFAQRGAGTRLNLLLQRAGQKRDASFRLHRQPKSVWTARDPLASGGWGYLLSVKGGNTFTTADALRELLKARKAMPSLEIPDQMINRAFHMLSGLRMKQPGSEVESYRYDAAGSFWRIKDIRADAGRINSAELACLMYSDTEFPGKIRENQRTQSHLAKTLEVFLEHRGILDLVKFPNGHGKLSIAPWFWMYAYRTTLEAASYLNINKELQNEIQKVSLKAFMQHVEFYHEPRLGEEGWIFGDDFTKELHDSCQMLDGLATMKPLWDKGITTADPKLKNALKAFRKSKYGLAWQELEKIQPAKPDDLKKMKASLLKRFEDRLGEIKTIHRKNGYDGLHHLREMMDIFKGMPKSRQLTTLAKFWEEQLRKIPLSLADLSKSLGPFPAKKEGSESDQAAWARFLKPSDFAPGFLSSAAPGKDARRGDWEKVAGQFISPREPYARLELPTTLKGSYQLDVEFTKIKGDCLALVLPVGKTSSVLVIGGWGGKVSGLALIDGRDADRNSTTRNGALPSLKRHTLSVKVTAADESKRSLEILMNGEPYLKWIGQEKQLTPDKEWSLRRAGSVGIGAYDSRIIFHSVALKPEVKK